MRCVKAEVDCSEFCGCKECENQKDLKLIGGDNIECDDSDSGDGNDDDTLENLFYDDDGLI